MIEYELFKQRERELHQQAYQARLVREAIDGGEPRVGALRRFVRGLRHSAPAVPLRAAGPAGY